MPPLLVLGATLLASVIIAGGVAAGMAVSGSASANATIKASENAMKGTIESARLQADAQKHISDNEKSNADADRDLRKLQDRRDAEMTQKWFAYLDQVTTQGEDFAHAERIHNDGTTTRISLEERRLPSPSRNL